MSNTEERLTECYSAITDAMSTNSNSADGVNAIKLLIRHVGAWPHRANLARYLSLGLRMDKSTSETKRRQAVRCLVLLELVIGGKDVNLAESLISRHDKKTLTQLQEDIRYNLPLFDKNLFRNEWHPHKFSMPADKPQAGPLARLPGDYDAATPDLPMLPFMYICFAIMNVNTKIGLQYSDIIADPMILRSLLISTSLINNEKVATYYPYGIILSVPSENIVATNSADQSFHNYNKEHKTEFKNEEDKRAYRLNINDVRKNVREGAATYPILSPASILNGTKGIKGTLGYNEVVVLGSYAGKEITPVAFFKKVHPRGFNYIHERSGSTFVTPAIDQMMQSCSLNLPVIRLLDTGGLGMPQPGKT